MSTCAFSNSWTRLRNDISSRHAPSKNAGHWSGEYFSIADMNIDLAFSALFVMTNLEGSCLYKAVRRLPVGFLTTPQENSSRGDYELPSSSAVRSHALA
jgi:hypothetical protein